MCGIATVARCRILASMRGTLVVSLVVWLSACAGLAADARNPIGYRTRASRSARLDCDHSDLNHEADAHHPGDAQTSSLTCDAAAVAPAALPTPTAAGFLVLPRAVSRAAAALLSAARPRAPPASF